MCDSLHSRYIAWSTDGGGEYAPVGVRTTLMQYAMEVINIL